MKIENEVKYFIVVVFSISLIILIAMGLVKFFPTQFESEVLVEEFSYTEDLTFHYNSSFSMRGKSIIARRNQGLTVYLYPKKPCFYFKGEYQSKDNKIIYSIDLDIRENNKRSVVERCLRNYVEIAQEMLIAKEKERLQVKAERNGIEAEIERSWE